MQELIKAYDEYIELLEESEGSLIGLAYAHGFRGAPDKLVRRGQELRALIARLKASLNGSKTQAEQSRD